MKRKLILRTISPFQDDNVSQSDLEALASSIRKKDHTGAIFLSVPEGDSFEILEEEDGLLDEADALLKHCAEMLQQADDIIRDDLADGLDDEDGEEGYGPTIADVNNWRCRYRALSNPPEPGPVQTPTLEEVCPVTETDPVEQSLANKARLDALGVNSDDIGLAKAEDHRRAVFCEHANECPTSICQCSTDCYCRAHTCRTQAVGG